MASCLHWMRCLRAPDGWGVQLVLLMRRNLGDWWWWLASQGICNVILEVSKRLLVRPWVLDLIDQQEDGKEPQLEGWHIICIHNMLDFTVMQQAESTSHESREEWQGAAWGMAWYLGPQQPQVCTLHSSQLSRVRACKGAESRREHEQGNRKGEEVTSWLN